MRIAHIILSRGFAGSERATAEMCNAHCREHQVLLVVRRDHRRNGVSIRDYIDPRVEVREVSSIWPRRGLAAALTAFQPDVIHAHLRRSTRLLAAIRPNAATIATLHLTWNGPHFAAMDGIICIADWQRNVIPPEYRGKIFRINESHIPHRRLTAAERFSLRQELGVSDDDYLIGAVGRVAKSKGFGVLIAAFKQTQLPQARLVILGEGRERRRLQRMANEHVKLAGFRDNVKDYYQAFDVFVSPSLSEPLGRVVLEALDAGVPVIATSTLGPSELIGEFGGTLVPINDVDALARALQQHYETRPRRQPADLNAYHLDRIAQATLDAYCVLVARRRA